VLRQQRRGKKIKTAESSFARVSDAHSKESESNQEVWANARLQSLVLSVPHYVAKASEDPNP